MDFTCRTSQNYYIEHKENEIDNSQEYSIVNLLTLTDSVIIGVLLQYRSRSLDLFFNLEEEDRCRSLGYNPIISNFTKLSGFL